MNSSLHGRSWLAWAVLILLNASAPAQDNSLPEVYIAVTVPETLEPSSNALVSPGEFTITRIGNTNEPLVLFVEFTGTATFGQDYQEVSHFLTMPPGESKLKILVRPLDDSAVEGDETVIATLSTNPPINSLPNYTVHWRLNRAAAVIHDNDFPNDRPVVSISGVSTVLEFCPPNADCAGISFSLWRTGPGLDQPLTVSLFYQGTAMADVDYRALPSQVTFEAGQEFASASSIPIDDTLYEGDETIIADIVEGFGYYVDPNRRQATTVIRDNDPLAPPVVSLELVERDAAETRIDQNAIFWAEFRVLRTGPATNELVVFLNTQQGSARLGEDYRLDGVNNNSTVRFPAGARSVNVRLYPIDDDFYEGDETVFFHLIAPPPGSDPYEIEFEHSSVAMVIHDNDPVTTRLDILSPRDGQQFQPGDIIELRAQIIGPGSSNSWIVEFFDGAQRVGTTVPGGAIFWRNVSGGQHVINARATNSAGDSLVARVTIRVGPGPAWPVVSITTPHLPGKTGEPCPVCFVAPGVFIISRTDPVTEPLTVYLEADGTATPSADYRALPRSVTIPAGSNSTQLLVLALDDQLVEGPEVVRATLVSPELANLGYLVNVHASEAFVVIGDDEASAPEARLDIIEPREGAQFAVGTAIQLSALGVYTRGEVFQPVEFYAGGTLIGRSSPDQPLRPFIPCLPSIHTIVWTNPPPGQHVLTARSQLSLNLWVTSPPVNITVSSPITTVLSIGASDHVATELAPSVGAFDPARFQVFRSGDLSRDLLAFFSVHGSASPGQDYSEWISPVRIPAGQQSATLEVLPIDDALREGVETISVRLEPSPLVGPLPTYEINPTSRDAVAVILDNDVAPGPALEIVSPTEGEHFTLPASIEIIAAAYHPTRDLLRVDFYAGEEKIGESSLVFDKPFSGGLIVHRFTWTQPREGSYALTARGFDENQSLVVTSVPVRIAVGPEPPRTVVRIEATSPIAEEDSTPFDRLNLVGVFTISRSGPTNESLPVYVQYSGSAVAGEDYPVLPWVVSIPAGAASTQIRVEPIADGVREGIETLVATVSNCPPPWLRPPCYDFEVDSARQSATVFIRDDGITGASLTMTNPKDGANFNLGETILIEATAIDLDGYISRVEFFDGNQRIGESEIVFIREPDHGTPIYHSFEWQGAASGPHVLTARATGTVAVAISSQPVHITVWPVTNRVVLEIAATDPQAAEAGEGGSPDPAVFTIRRVSGPRDVEVGVFYSLAGTAQNGIDYDELSGHAWLPSGAESVRLVVTPIQDRALEGEETVIARLELPICPLRCCIPPPPACYLIAGQREARVVIRDGAPNQPPAVTITKPASGAEFPLDTLIEIVAETRDPDGYVPKVEFFADGRKIGEQSIVFIQPPPPGQTQTFTFVWRQPVPGSHALTARATDDDGAAATSAPVEIKVGMSEPLPIVRVTAPVPFAVEPRSNAVLNTATFRIRRHGPTNDALAVAYSLQGTAGNGTDYEMLSGSATIPAGRRSVPLIVRPRADNLSENVETLILRLEPGSASNPYRVGQANVAVAVISDEPWSPSLGGARCSALSDFLHVCFAAETGYNFRLECSSDFRNWETLFDTVSSDGAWHFIDRDRENQPRRFYRLTPEPVAENDE